MNQIEKEEFVKGLEAKVGMINGVIEERGFRNGWKECLEHIKSMAHKRNTKSINVEELDLL